jgi:hypothetical protein
MLKAGGLVFVKPPNPVDLHDFPQLVAFRVRG